MAKKISDIQQKLLGKPNINNFEKTFVIYTSLALTIISIISLLLNNYIYIEVPVKYILGSSVTFYTGIFLISRFTKKLFFVKIAISVMSLVFVNFLWVYYYNSKGPVLFAFAVYFSLMLFIWDSKKFIYLFFLILINIAILFVVEYYHPEILNTDITEKARIWNMYIGLIVYLSVIYVYTIAAKNNYMNQYKKARESERLKSAFLHNLSHEIRTPLNAIVGFSSIIVNERSVNKDKLKKAITENSEHLIRLIDDMIDMSMIETNQLSIKKTRFNLYDSLKNLYEIFKLQETGNVTLEVEFGNEDLIINTDKTRLEQILINLLKNAFKFTEEGIVHFGYSIEKKNIRFFNSNP